MKFFGIRHRVRAACAGASTVAALVAAPLGVPSAQVAPSATGGVTLKYPATARSGQSDDLNGVRVPDPYRWLESISAPEVRNWVSAQNALTESFLSRVSRRTEIRDLVSRSWRYSKVGAPFPGGERLFFYENSGLENQSALYVQDKPDLAPRVLIDPNAFSGDGLIAIVDQAPSPDGRYLAYAVATQGSTWRSVRVRDVRSSQDVGDELQGLKDSPIAWTSDARGFFYTRVDGPRPGTTPNPIAPDGREQVYYHRLGRPQSEDRLMFEAADHPTWLLRANVSDDGQYLVISARYGFEFQNRLFLIDLDNPKRPNLGAPIVKLFDEGDAVYDFIGNSGPLFFIRTTKGAPRARLVAVDINMPDENHWTTIVRESYDPLIELRHVDDRIVAHRLHDAHSVLELYGLDGSARGSITLPGVGTVTAMHGHAENREFYFSFTSFLQPPAIYRYDLDARNIVPWRETRPDTSLSQFETAQLFFTSKDGTRVPMFVVRKEGTKTPARTVLYGYGGFNVNQTPAFSARVLSFVERGGVWASSVLRGGGEYGEAWHQAGMRDKKQNVFDDFYACAESLIASGTTTPKTLAAVGGSNGGLLASAAVTQRPDLFSASVALVPLADMLRYHLFRLGAFWISEYGSPDIENEFHVLRAYSPLHHVEKRAYPAMLFWAAESDSRVDPMHARKMAASMQEATTSGRVVLLRVETKAGHGMGKPTAKIADQLAAELAFIEEETRG